MRMTTFALLLACSLVACSDDEKSSTPGTSSGTNPPSGTSSGSNGTSGTVPTTTSTSYKGTFAGPGGEGGALDVTVTSSTAKTQTLHIATANPVSGSLKLSGGATISITGTYDDESKVLSISGGGYAFTGTFGADGIQGTYTGPKGAGNFAVFSGEGVTPWCGTFAGDESGVWNFVVAGDKVAGSAVDGQGRADVLSGTVAGTKLTIVTKNKSTAEGTIAGATATGTWANESGSAHGTWTGKSGCTD